jgi:hypothetical protein
MATVQYDAKTGKKLSAGATTTDAKGNTYKQGTTVGTSSGSSSGRLVGANGLTYSPEGLSSDKAAAREKKVVTPGSEEMMAGQVPGAIDPTQPSPTKVQAGAGLPGAPGTAPGGVPMVGGQTFAQASAGITDKGQLGTLAQKYQQAKAQSDASGIGAPATKGQANPMMPTVTAPEPSPLTDVVETDTNFDSIFAQFDDYFSPPKQKQSLLQEYKGLEKSLGINALNEELLNSKRIIEGTEDDIRSEVQAVSGFATDSQVMALANARNKSLVKNYNYLLESRDSAMTQLNTMMNLSIQDRQMAEQEFDRKMNFAFKVAEFKDRAVNNAREAYNNVIRNVGYAGLYKSLQQDPSSIPVVEKTLGMKAGQLQGLASYTPPADPKEALQIEGLRLDNAKKRQELNATVGGVDEKTMGKIQASPEYKTINGVLPAIQALASYKEAINKYGGSETFSGTGKGELAGTYGNAIAAWKTLAGLGALSGADFALAENAVPSTGFFQRNSTMKAKLNASIDNAIQQAQNLTTRLTQNYPGAKDNLTTQLDYAKAIAYPDKFKVGPDGQVYELTN